MVSGLSVCAGVGRAGRGEGLVTYALIVALIAIVAILALILLGTPAPS
jgi:hypothetical protein